MTLGRWEQLTEEQRRRFAEALHKPLMDGLLFGSLLTGGLRPPGVDVVAKYAVDAAERAQSDYGRWVVERRTIERPGRMTIDGEFEAVA
jgi:hypothetical protein